jgi:hypothetical protein
MADGKQDPVDAARTVRARQGFGVFKGLDELVRDRPATIAGAG